MSRYLSQDEVCLLIVLVLGCAGRDRPDVAAYLALFEHKIRDHSKLSVPEVQAVAAFLSSSVKEFAVFTHADAVLKVCSRSMAVPPLCHARITLRE